MFNKLFDRFADWLDFGSAEDWTAVFAALCVLSLIGAYTNPVLGAVCLVHSIHWWLLYRSDVLEEQEESPE